MIQYIPEFIGTFILVAVILVATSEKQQLGHIAPIAIGMALTVAIYISGTDTSGHFNPLVTMVMVLKDSIKVDESIPYIVAQLLGAIAAFSYSEHAHEALL